MEFRDWKGSRARSLLSRGVGVLPGALTLAALALPYASGQEPHFTTPWYQTVTVDYHNLIALAVGDVNNDGHIDICAKDREENNVPLQVHFGDGRGGLSLGQLVPVKADGSSVERLVFLDGNNDGSLDLAGNWLGQGAVFLPNDGTGNYGAYQLIPGVDGKWTTAGDFDLDGFDDIVVGHIGGVRSIAGSASGMTVVADYNLGAHSDTSAYVSAGDFDSDGDQDIIYVRMNWSGTSGIQTFCLLNDSIGNFFAHPITYLPLTTAAVACDIDGDGFSDDFFAGVYQGIGSPPSGIMHTFLGTTSGLFSYFPTSPNTPPSPAVVALSAPIPGNFYGGPQLDIAVRRYGMPTIMEGDGSGVFSTHIGANFASDWFEGVAADFNEDGRLDLVTASYAEGGVTIALSDTNGIPGGYSPASIPCGNAPHHALADLDHDGDTDAVCVGCDGFYAMLNDGSGSFSLGSITTVYASYQPLFNEIGDFDSDGNGEVIGIASNSLRVYKPNSTLNFAQWSSTTFPSSAKSTDLCIADLDSDGDLDAAIHHSGTGNNSGLRLLRNNGTGVFQWVTLIPESYTSNADDRAAELADLNADGRIDAIFLADGGAPRVVVALAATPFNYPAKQSFPVLATAPRGLTVSDLDGSGTLDIALTTFPVPSNYRQVEWFLNPGDAVLQHSGTRLLSNRAPFLISSDVNGDQRMDLIGCGAELVADLRVISCLLGEPNGGFASSRAYKIDVNSDTFRFADVTGDGAIDVVSDTASTVFGLVPPPTCGNAAWTLGTGCAGSGGFTPALTPSGCADAGAKLNIVLSHALGGSTALLILSPGQQATPIGGGCTLYPQVPSILVLPIPLPGISPGTGGFSLSTIVPTGFFGVTATMQAFVLDLGAALGYSSTNGVAVSMP